jgi:hypothetical protein
MGNGNSGSLNHTTEIAHDSSVTVDCSSGLLNENPPTLDHMVEFPYFKWPFTGFSGSFAHSAGGSPASPAPLVARSGGIGARAGLFHSTKRKSACFPRAIVHFPAATLLFISACAHFIVTLLHFM